MHERSERVLFLDFMRGFAVAIMVMGHSIDSVLSLDFRTTEVFRLYDAVRGFTAPMFLFISGFAFSIATEKRWEQYLVPSASSVKRFLKLIFLLATGYALHFPFLSFNKIVHDTKPEEYAQFFQVDVLHCVAVTMLLLHVLMLITRTPRAFAISALFITIGIILATPLVWARDFASVVSPGVTPYLNQKQPSIFPLFPYAAFLIAGTVIGHLYLEARRLGTESVFFKRIVGLSFACGISGVLFDLVPVILYPPHDYWKTSPNFFLVRLSIILLLTAGFHYARRMPAAIGSQLVRLGQASLIVYVVHLIIVYGSSANDGLMQVLGQTLAYPEAFIVGLCVLSGMIFLVHAREYLRTHHHMPLRFAQIALAGTLLFNFFTKPW